MRQHCIGVVAHHQRHDQAQQLADTVDAVTIQEDAGTLGAGANHRRGWQILAKHHSQWSILLEDDCLPVKDFVPSIGAALTHAPTNIVSCYLGRGRPPQHQQAIGLATEKANANDAAWIIATHLFHAVAVAVRTNLIPHMLTHLARRHYLPIDEAISQWARTNKHSVAYTWPSLVDHDDTLPTLIKHRDGRPRTPGRTAWQTGPRTSYDTTTVQL